MVWRKRVTFAHVCFQVLWRKAVASAMTACVVCVVWPAVHAQGLSAQPQELAPNLLSVPGEAMLTDPPPEPQPLPIEASPLGLQADEVGMASWYGQRFHRRRTASGELFDMRALTAAHPTLPFGTRVCVRSEATGRSVVVRINDRGPHIRNRVIDLSRGAAGALGVMGLGLKPVEIFALDSGEAGCPAP